MNESIPTTPYDALAMASTIKAGANDTELRILEAAKDVFMEKGFAETSMGDIASRAGISRTSLHYYFRTKDRIFQTAFGMMIGQITPKVYKIVKAKEVPVTERVRGVVDAYYSVFKSCPTLPFFVMREIDRDADFILHFIRQSSLRATFKEIVESVNEEMAEGRLRQMPISILCHTFYGFLTFPFLVRNLSKLLLTEKGMTFDEWLEQWKPHIVAQITGLLQAN